MLFDLFAEKTNRSVHPDPVAFPVAETSDRVKAPLAVACSSLPCAMPCISPVMFGFEHSRTSPATQRFTEQKQLKILPELYMPALLAITTTEVIPPEMYIGRICIYQRQGVL